MPNNINQIVTTSIVIMVMYLVLIIVIGINLVNFILMSVFGSTLPWFLALIVAMFTGPVLIPTAIVVWILNVTHILNHYVVSALPIIKHLG